MGKREKLIRKILSGSSDRNVLFADLVALLEFLGFEHRTSGSHHIFTKQGISDRVTLQSDSGTAKAYQVRQIRRTLAENNLIKDE